MNEQDQFELGMTVHDRHRLSPDDAVIVNLPDIPINEFVIHHDGRKKVTVADDNPGYDPQQKVVVVVYQSDLDVYGGEYTGDSPISFDALSRNNISYYGFPPQRLVPDDLRYNTDPPVSVGTPLIGESQFLDPKQMELAVVDNGFVGSNNRIARTDKESGICVGPVPADPGESTFIIPLSGSQSTNYAKLGFCVIILDSDDIGDFSSTDYIDSMLSLSQLSASELKEQLSHAIEFDEFDSPIEHFDTYNEPQGLEKESQIVDLSEKESETQNNNSQQKKAQGDRIIQKSKPLEGDSETKKAIAEPDLEELRSEARASSSEDPSKTEPESTRRKVQDYTRSSKVREYVKQRADGICEGCGDPAPFTSKTGEPYLHAHHINELSNSGSDTIESVIALCPNCHYRVHHGQDGDKYNEKLLEIVHRVEDVE